MVAAMRIMMWMRMKTRYSRKMLGGRQGDISESCDAGRDGGGD
jgi:hypothetical protein